MVSGNNNIKKRPAAFSVELKDLKRVISVGFFFGLIKLLSFSSVILLTKVVSDVSEYGLFEYALGVGILLAVVLNFGLQGAYPYFNLKLNRQGFVSLFYLHGLIIGSLILLVSLLIDYQLFIIAPKYALSVLIGGVVSLQMVLSSIWKSHEQTNKAVLLDGGVLILLFGYILYLFINQNSFSFATFKFQLYCYLASLLLFYSFQFWKTKNDFSRTSYLEAVQYGKHLILSAFLVIFVTNGGRILVDYFFSLEEVGYYTFYLRFATLGVMMSQVFLVAFFKKIYQAEPSKLDQLFTLVITMILVALLALWKIIPFVLSGSIELLGSSIDRYSALYFSLSFHVFFWVAIAFNSNIIHREQLTSKMNGFFIIVIGLMILAMFLLNSLSQLTLFSLIVINLFCLFFIVEFQLRILNRNGVHLGKFKWVNRLTLLLFAGTFSFI